jgi:chemotaxis protein MotB
MPPAGGAKSGHGAQELWLITYGDLLTLLMAFFVMLYATLTGKAEGAGQGVSQALRRYQMEIFQQIASGAQGGMIMMPGSNQVYLMQSSGPDMLQRDLADWTSSVTGYAQVQASGDQIKVTLGADLLFDSGSARLSDEGARALHDLALLLVQHAGDITVTGHTDDRPFGSGDSDYGDNWMLSVSRAVAVVRTLEQSGVRPRRLKAVGYGSTRPRDPEGRTGEAYDAWQRRVEIIITPISDLLETEEGIAFSESEATTIAGSGQVEAPAGMEGMALLGSYEEPTAKEPEKARQGPIGEPPQPGSVAVDREKPEGKPPPLPAMPGRRPDLDNPGASEEKPAEPAGAAPAGAGPAEP